MHPVPVFDPQEIPPRARSSIASIAGCLSLAGRGVSQFLDELLPECSGSVGGSPLAPAVRYIPRLQSPRSSQIGIVERRTWGGYRSSGIELRLCMRQGGRKCALVWPRLPRLFRRSDQPWPPNFNPPTPIDPIPSRKTAQGNSPHGIGSFL